MTHQFTFIVPNSNLSQCHSVAFLAVNSSFFYQKGWFHWYQRRFDCSKSSLEIFDRIHQSVRSVKSFQHLLSWSHVCWLWTQQMLNKWCHTDHLEKTFCENSCKHSKIRLFRNSYFTQHMLATAQQAVF